MNPNEWNISIGNLTLADIPTFSSDMLIFLTAFILSFQIRKMPISEESNHMFRFFRLLGFSTLISGFGHLLKVELTQVYFQLSSWLILGWAVYNLQLFGIDYVQSEKRQMFLKKLIRAEYIIYATAQMLNPVFAVAEMNLIFGVLGIFLPIIIFDYRLRKQRYSQMIILSILVLIVSALAHGLKVDVDPKYFDHRSVGHIFVVGFLGILFYAMNLKSKTDAGRPLTD